jgi:hypothetical protein
MDGHECNSEYFAKRLLKNSSAKLAKSKTAAVNVAESGSVVAALK